MAAATQHRFSGPVTVFQERRLPERATPAGYSALIGAFDLQVPLPRTLSAIGERHRITEEGGWRIMTPRHAPHATLEGHLTFALKYEGLDLAVLKRLFLAAGSGAIEDPCPRKIDRQLRPAHLVPLRVADRPSPRTCRMPTAADTSRSSIRSSNTSLKARTRRATVSGTTCRAHPPSALWSFVRRPWSSLSA